MQTITVDYQVIEKDFTWWDKAKRFGRSLQTKAQNFLQTVREKTREAARAIAQFFDRLMQTSNRCVDEVIEIFEQIQEDWDMGNPIAAIRNFLFGPSEDVLTQTAGNYTEFNTGDVANTMMAAVTAQNGYVSDEQVEQFGAIAQNSTENLKRLKVVLEAIKKVSGNETEASKEVYRVLSQLEKNGFKRAEYQYNRRREHNLLQEKYQNLRRGL